MLVSSRLSVHGVVCVAAPAEHRGVPTAHCSLPAVSADDLSPECLAASAFQNAVEFSTLHSQRSNLRIVFRVENGGFVGSNFTLPLPSRA